jgi:hypothetical protein
MPIDIEKIETQMRGYLSFFDKSVYKETLKELGALIQLWKKLHSGTHEQKHRRHHDQEYRRDFAGTFNAIKAATMREEFLARAPTAGSAAIFDSIDNMFSRLTQTDKAHESGRLFRDIVTRTEVFTNISATKRKVVKLSKLSLDTLPHETRFYISCFMFLLAMEGMYDEVVRCVYAHEQIIEGEQVLPKKLWSERIDAIKRKIGIAPKPIFDVWDKGHRVRNAIAHGSFFYSDDSKKMRFVDANPYDPTDVYTTSMAINEIEDLVRKIEVIEIAFRDLVILLNIYSFVMTPPERQFELPP